MSKKSVGIAAVLAAALLMTAFTTAMTLSMNYAEGQSLTPCPVGYHRSPSGLFVLDTLPPATLYPPGTTFPTTENRTEENIVCSGFSYTCG